MLSGGCYQIEGTKYRKEIPFSRTGSLSLIISCFVGLKVLAEIIQSRSICFQRRTPMVIARNLILDTRIPDIEYSWWACRFKLRSTESNCKNFVDAKSQDDKCPWFRYISTWHVDGPQWLGGMEFLLVDNKDHSFYVTSRQSVKSFFRQERQHWWISEERLGRYMSCPKGMLYLMEVKHQARSPRHTCERI